MDFNDHTPLYLGMYEWELHRFFYDSLPGTSIAYDVGGHLGYDALMAAANLDRDGRVVTFEPNRERATVLRENVSLNPALEPKVTVSEMAVGAASADGMTTLDEVAEEYGPADLIKIDIDGGERDALSGGEKLLREHRPHLIVETHSPELEQDCGQLLLSWGYRPVIKHNRTIWREYRHGINGVPHNRWLLASGSPGRA